ncbi:MAG TPA: acyl-CoA dehydratase activase [Desulfurivibrionaceae bacterium]|nr:acyl-CoA dehydratase activase [Desulfurivibrionaceae bacterium]
MKYFAGVDIGSTTIKIALLDQSEALRAWKITPTGSLFHQNTIEAFTALLAEHGLHREEIAYAVATGYGRKLYRNADESISEITANAVGAGKIGGGNGRVRTIINIGGQDLKVIRLDEQGHVVNFAMNDKCAAGTGRFLEMAARNLEVEVDALGDYHARLQGVPTSINSTCTVFAESEIIGLLAKGDSLAEIIAGIHFSIARRVARLVRRLGLEEPVFFDGGPALNKGLVGAIETELMCELLVPEVPQLTTAIGAALLAANAYGDQEERGHAA